jgi:hypothetical protein
VRAALTTGDHLAPLSSSAAARAAHRAPTDALIRALHDK